MTTLLSNLIPSFLLENSKKFIAFHITKVTFLLLSCSYLFSLPFDFHSVRKFEFSGGAGDYFGDRRFVYMPHRRLGGMAYIPCWHQLFRNLSIILYDLSTRFSLKRMSLFVKITMLTGLLNSKIDQLLIPKPAPADTAKESVTSQPIA